MRYREIQNVWEAFDQPYSIKWEEGDDIEAVDALATLGDGTYLSIMFNKEFGDYGDDLGDWAIEFHRNNSQEVSGEGDAQRVFATVLEAIRQFVKKYKPNTVTFSASKEPEPDMVRPGANANPESRAKLYNRLVDRYAGAMGYSAQQHEGNGKVTYILRQSKQDVAESLRVDVPNEEWLQNAIDYAKQKSPDRNGLPYMGKTTATVRSVDVPVNILKRIPGMRREQQNVRQGDLAAIVKIMSDTGKLPLHGHTGEEYKPFINVAYDGSAWVNEGNHRIMAAAKLGWETLPVEISYFDGGERVETGAMYPGKIGLGQVTENFADGKVKGKSRPGRVKRAGASCDGSVSSLRQRAKKASGEKAKMYHWCANMKSGRNK